MEDATRRPILDIISTMARYVIYEELGTTGPEKNWLLFSLRSAANLEEAYLLIKGSWVYRYSYGAGHKIHIVGVEKDHNNTYVVDNSQGYVIVEPDTLISCTSVGSSYFCDRQTVFNHLMPISSDRADALKGIIAHEILGHTLKLDKKRQNSGQLNEFSNRLVNSRYIRNMALGVRLTQQELVTLATDLIPYILELLDTSVGRRANFNEPLDIEEVVDVEECFWNPIYGLKGRVDSTLKVRKKHQNKVTSSIIPFEFKSGAYDTKYGRAKSHYGQVQLYSLLMEGKYGEIKESYTYYLLNGTWVNDKIAKSNLNELVISRNNLVVQMESVDGEFSNLSLPVASESICAKCEYVYTCALNSRPVPKEGEIPLEPRATATEIYLFNQINHLNEEEIDFYHKWFNIITRETEIFNRKSTAKNLWTQSESAREESGLCISMLEFKYSYNEGNDASRGTEVFAVFERSSSAPTFNFSALDIREFDYVVISTKYDVSISGGFVHEVRPETEGIVIRFSRPVGVLEQETVAKSKMLFSVDKISTSSPISQMYVYLNDLMLPRHSSERLRSYVIAKRPIEFNTVRLREFDSDINYFRGFNPHQIVAILRCYATNSVCCVKGVPGSGKTSTICGLIDLLVKKGKKVLLTAYTGTALDNILIRYHKDGGQFIRIGEPKIRDPSVLRCTDANFCAESSTLDDYVDHLMNVPVVATTLLSLKHEIFRRRSFDYLIIDEATQALPVAAFGAMHLAHKYALFGDPMQLPPLLTSQKGAPESIFSLMSNERNTIGLNVQYRMNDEVMSISNTLTYNGVMKSCHSIRKKFLKISQDKLPQYDLDRMTPLKRGTLYHAMSRLPSLAAIFFDVHGEEVTRDESLVNEMEMRVVRDMIKLLVDVEVDGSRIGVIAPYRAQVSAIKKEVRELGMKAYGVEVCTIDQFQGQEKDIIICSWTKTKECPESSTDSILHDESRLNVAITRAKIKLIMLGKIKALQTYGPFKKLLQLMSQKQCTYKCYNPFTEPSDMEA